MKTTANQRLVKQMLQGTDGFQASYKCVNSGGTYDGEGEPVPESRGGC